MATYEAYRAQPPVVFPLSGPPICVALGHPLHPGVMRSVHNERNGASFIDLSDTIHHAKTPAEKFYLEPSKQHEGLLHVRCCDNNKYWVAQQHVQDGSTCWFIGTADEPEEDLGKPSCTLFDFRPDNQYSRVIVRLYHPQQKKYASMFSSSFSKTSLQLVHDLEADSIAYTLSVFTVNALSLQKELPRFVAFKGASGKYLVLKDSYLQFSSSDITDPAVVHETSTDEYGVVRIRSNGSDRFWRLRPAGWICADSNDAIYATDSILGEKYTNDHVYHDVNTLFRVVIKYDNYIALQNLSNGRFCKRLTDDGKMECLSACVDDSSTTGDAEFQIEEPVRSREIYDVQYRYGAKKTSTQRELSRTIVLSTNRTNETHYAQTTLELYERSESRWDARFTLDAGIKANLKASIPFKIIDIEGSVESHIDIKGEYNWGKADMEEVKTSTVYKYPVPPMTKVICDIYATKEVIDVPFSYKQKDVLFSGEVLPTRELHDGMYHGMKVNEIDIETSEEKI